MNGNVWGSGMGQKFIDSLQPPPPWALLLDKGLVSNPLHAFQLPWDRRSFAFLRRRGFPQKHPFYHSSCGGLCYMLCCQHGLRLEEVNWKKSVGPDCVLLAQCKSVTENSHYFYVSTDGIIPSKCSVPCTAGHCIDWILSWGN